MPLPPLIIRSWTQVIRGEYDRARLAHPHLMLDTFLRAEIRTLLTKYGAGAQDKPTRRQMMLDIRSDLWGGHPPPTPED